MVHPYHTSVVLMHAAPLGVGDGAAKSVNYTCVNYKLDGRKATFWNEKKKKKK